MFFVFAPKEYRKTRVSPGFSQPHHRHLNILLHLKGHEFIISSDLDGNSKAGPLVS